tara:strand:- start:165 stop:788 length:624 start_codon:yes stop_codon:yes gene_type:complete
MNKKNFKPKSYADNAIDYFKERIGKIVTSSELAQLTGKNGKQISHNIRRIFELRDERGYDIVNHKNNEETGLNLKVDEWVLRSPIPNPNIEKVKNRQINKRVRIEVFERDNFTCVTCGLAVGDDDPSKPGRQIKLHCGHKESLINQIKNNADLKIEGSIDDFVTQCNICNEGLKSKNIKPLDWVKRIEELPNEEKKKIYDHLKIIFE